MMRAWVEADDQDREFLVRTGTGLVTAVVPVGIVGPDNAHTFYRVEIYCDAPGGRPGAIRYSVHPVVAADDELFEVASGAQKDMWPVVWSAQWHRHDWIPVELPVSSLNLATDARCILAALDRIVAPELATILDRSE
jgi:hypothetical protein